MSNDYYTTTTPISDAAIAEKNAKWHEIPDVGAGYTAPLLHPDWRALWAECVAAKVTTADKLGLELDDNSVLIDTCRGFWYMRCNQRGEISLEG